MTGKQAIKVKIFGSEYQVKGEADPAYMESLAAMVDEKMRELAQPGSAQAGKAAILAAFNLADELSRLKQAHQELKRQHEQLRGQVEELDAALRQALEPEAPSESPALPLESEPAPEPQSLLTLEEEQN
jgi:cell division protein ZapA